MEYWNEIKHYISVQRIRGVDAAMPYIEAFLQRTGMELWQYIEAEAVVNDAEFNGEDIGAFFLNHCRQREAEKIAERERIDERRDTLHRNWTRLNELNRIENKVGK